LKNRNGKQDSGANEEAAPQSHQHPSSMQSRRQDMSPSASTPTPQPQTDKDRAAAVPQPEPGTGLDSPGTDDSNQADAGDTSFDPGKDTA
jgi:hypothetical protein